MQYYIWIILLYFLLLAGYNFYKARKVKSQDDFMVAGRSLSLTYIVFTLICTWIGSGTFIAGAEYAAKAGFSSLWMPAGAWFGIAIIYFLAAKIRTFGQYTIGDILEVRYGKFARIFGAIALVISFVTIVSYQFRAGGYILNVITDGYISVEVGQALSAGFVILFTALGGMVAVAHTDLPNGIIIVLACIAATPFTIAAAGGMEGARAVLPPEHFAVFSADFGEYPALKALGYCLSTMLLLMGVQSMYQKFYSAKSPKEAKQGVALWIVGTIIVETVVVVIAVFAAAKFTDPITHKLTVDPASIVLQAARYLVPQPFGILLLAAACAVVVSTGMNYLLSPSTNIIRDFYQRFINPQPESKRVVALQKIFVVILGFIAFLLIFIPTVMKSNISVLRYSYFAYTIYGVAITPALVSALVFKRVNRLGGLLSITIGAFATIFMEIIFPQIFPHLMKGDDPFGIPSIFLSFSLSILGLVLGSVFGKPPTEEELKPFFPDN